MTREQALVEAARAIREEGMRNHNTRCRDWWSPLLAALSQYEDKETDNG